MKSLISLVIYFQIFQRLKFTLNCNRGRLLKFVCATLFCSWIHHVNHNYNKILESDWFLARPIFYQIGARAAKVSNNEVSNNKVSNNKVSNNKVRVLRMRALLIWFLVVSFKNGFFAFISDDKSLVGFALSNFFLEFCYTYD